MQAVVAAPLPPFRKPANETATIGIRMIQDSKQDYLLRMKEIDALPTSLKDADWQALQSFLLKADPSDKEQLSQVLKNRLLDALCAMNPPPSGLGDTLIQMYRDHNENVVLRDYAVQHLAAYYEQLGENQTEARQAVQGVLWEALLETDDSIAGTALLGLDRLSKDHAEIDQGQLASDALLLATDKQAGELSHITALQVCAHLGMADALPLALQIAQNGETISMRISAVGVMGLLGGSDQIPFLKNLLQNGDDRFQPAIRHALDQITARTAH
jgi:hypothetical protein